MRGRRSPAGFPVLIRLLGRVAALAGRQAGVLGAGHREGPDGRHAGAHGFRVLGVGGLLAADRVGGAFGARHRDFVREAGNVPDGSTVLLDDAGEEAGDIRQGGDRGVEGVADLREACGLPGGLDVQDTPAPRASVGPAPFGAEALFAMTGSFLQHDQMPGSDAVHATL